ncbi:GTP-binding protein Rho1, partial [Serendipita sp. 399]
DKFIPSCAENVDVDIHVLGRHVILNIWDIRVQEEFNIRYAAKMRDATVAIVCFGINDTASIHAVEAKWFPEVKHYTTAPIILVGCKSDIRERSEKTKRCISTEEGRNMASLIGAEIYLECSAFTGEGVEDVFNHAARLSIRRTSALKKAQSRDGRVIF